MQIIIQILDEENIEEMMAVGAKDLKEHFLKKIGINANKVVMLHIDMENVNKRLLGEEYKQYRDKA